VANTAGWMNANGVALVGSATTATDGTFTLNAHGLVNGQLVEFRTTAGGAIAVLVANAEYYVRNAATNTFQVSATPGGAIMTFASTGSADTWAATPEYSALDQRRLNAITLHPDTLDPAGAREGVRPHTTNPVTLSGTTYNVTGGLAVVYPRETSTSGPYPVYYDATSASLNPADGSNDRLDGIDLQVQDDDEDGQGQRRARIVYVPGTPSGSPVEPELTENSLRLAAILVESGGSPGPSISRFAQYALGPGILPLRDATEYPDNPYLGMPVYRIDTQTFEVWTGAWTPLASTANYASTRRIATTVRTTNSASFTSETLINSVTASLVSGKTYRVKWMVDVASTVAGDLARVRLRQDSVAGTEMQLVNRLLHGTTTDYQAVLEAEYTAGSTGNKTFVGTVTRQFGTGNLACNANANQPQYLYVDYIRG